MKTSIDLPDALCRQAKMLAVARGVTFRQFFIEALEEHIRQRGSGRHSGSGQPPWMAGFGALSDLGDEHHRIRKIIEEEFEKIENEILA